MTNAELQERISKVLIKIEKIDKRISKWGSKMNEESFIKEEAPWYSKEPKKIKTLGDLITARFNSIDSRYEDSTLDTSKKYIEDSFNSYLEKCGREVKYAIRDKEEQQVLLAKYKNMIALNDEKHSKPVIEIVKKFFEGWKNHIIEYAEARLKVYYEVDRELCAEYNNTPWEIRKTLEWRNQHNEKYKENRAILTGWTGELYERREEGFLKYIDKYMEDRYFELVDKVTAITGDITDISELYIGSDGSLNGKIFGETGAAKVETIVAGGYNIQCLHYRVLVHKLKQ